MIHSSFHIENLLKTNNAAKIAAQEIRKTNTTDVREWMGVAKFYSLLYSANFRIFLSVYSLPEN